MKNIQIIEADLFNEGCAKDVLSLLTSYATDIMGGGEDLPEEVKKKLIPALQNRNGVYVFLAYDVNKAVALAICFEGFSTFYAQPLINIHDFVVEKSYRKMGIARLLLNAIEDKARSIEACKLTLEVLEGNKRAQDIYKTFGFAGYELDKSMGKALFMDKKL
jgi:GNAT superfamily N-acetyltransferase